MNLSDRERRLLVALAAMVVIMAVYFLVLRGDGAADEVAIPDLFPSPTVSEVVATPQASPTPTGFVVPPDARDPFRP